MSHKVAVTGAGSPIGADLLVKLRSSGFETVQISHQRTKLDSSNLYADISKPTTASELFSTTRVDTVVHLGQRSLLDCGSDKNTFINQNRDFCKNLVKSAASSGVAKLIYASSAAIYGDQNSHPSNEFSEVFDINPYAEMKLKCEEEILSASQKYGIETISLRIFNVYGKDLNTSLINRLVTPETEQKVILKGPHNFVRDYIHIADVSANILEVIDAQSGLPDVLNIGTGIATSNTDILKLLPERLLKNISIVASEPSYSVSDNTFSSKYLSAPKQSLEDYIETYI